jgi:prepilin-type processing-associated H-X9-DG protein
LIGLKACDTAWQGWSFSGTSLERGDYWGHGGMPMTLFNTVAPPSYSSGNWAYCGDNVASGVYSVYSNANSRHAGGVNTLLADGHVQFIKNSISQNTWLSLGTIAGGEVVSSDSY